MPDLMDARHVLRSLMAHAQMPPAQFIERGQRSDRRPVIMDHRLLSGAKTPKYLPVGTGFPTTLLLAIPRGRALAICLASKERLAAGLKPQRVFLASRLHFLFGHIAEQGAFALWLGVELSARWI